ncbi:MAG: hypothetical protein M1352_00435 [Patescibacteria group bacterium]|nr:hypothetical protein [Patescibacteria group bacterium]
MPTQLAKTAKATRVVFFGSIFLIIFYLIFAQAFGLIIGVIKSLLPIRDVPATVGFGKLPKINLRSFKLSGNPPAYELDTITGDLPQMPKKIEVYPVVEPKASYLSLDKAKDVAKRLGFSTDPQSISSSTYYWEQDYQTLKMNIFTQNFTLESDLTKLVIPIGQLPDAAAVAGQAEQLLSGKGLLMYGYENGNQTATMAQIDNGQIIRAQGSANASLARIDFFRTLNDPADKSGKTYPPLLPPNPKEGNIQMLVYAPRKNVDLLNLNYNNWEIDKNSPQTYPLRPITAAWQDVTSGQAAIAYVQDKAATSFDYPSEVELAKVFIRKVYLAYFDDINLQSYLQPIYVFDGDATDSLGKPYDFTAYALAIDPAWTQP